MYYPGKNRLSDADPEVPHSLDGVLNSLETLLEHRNHEVPESVQEAMESFADSISEQPGDTLTADTGNQATLEQAPVEIPVLKDIVSQGDVVLTQPADDVANNADLDVLLDALRAELDVLVDDILEDARDRFTEVLESASSKNSISLKDNLNDFMRGALERRDQDK